MKQSPGGQDAPRAATASAWARYLELLDPMRPGLFRYCRRLTGDVWAAEDLVQDALVHGFAKLGTVHHEITNPQAYVLRIASNLWVDRMRRESAEARAIAAEATQIATPAADSTDAKVGVRDAGAVLLRELSPQERAAFLLKEVFDLTLAEIASTLGTTIGAIKAALHRARGRIRDYEEEAPMRKDAPDRATLDLFVDRYNQRDLPALLSLMLDGATIEMYGHVYEAGRDTYEREGGWWHHNFHNPWDGKPTDAYWEIAEFRGAPVVLVQYGPEKDRTVGSVMRIETQEERVARIRVYALCPDVVLEVAQELGRPVAPSGLYRFPG